MATFRLMRFTTKYLRTVLHSDSLKAGKHGMVDAFLVDKAKSLGTAPKRELFWGNLFSLQAPSE